MRFPRDFLKAASISASTTALGLLTFYYQDKDDHNDGVHYYLHPDFMKGSARNRDSRHSSERIGKLLAENRRIIVGRQNLTHCDPISSHNDSHPPMQMNKNDNQQFIEPSPITKTQSILYKLFILNDETLPTPRLLSPNDPIFTYRKMKRGLKQRERDETRLRNMQSEIIALVEKQRQQKGNTSSIKQEENNVIMEKISEIAYGKGITPQMREDFLIVSFQMIFALGHSYVALTNLHNIWPSIFFSEIRLHGIFNIYS